MAVQLLSSGAVDTAFLIALSGEDEALARSLVDGLSTDLPDTKEYWDGVTNAWFGDAGARANHDVLASARPTRDLVLWSWRLASRACDQPAIEKWERALYLGWGIQAASPAAINLSPESQSRQLPSRYPNVVWRNGFPERPYIGGMLTFDVGRPACQS